MKKFNKYLNRRKENKDTLITLLISNGYFDIKNQRDILNYIKILPKQGIIIN
jgi:hypothetical protein